MTTIIPLIAGLIALGQPAATDQASPSSDQEGRIIFYRRGAVLGSALACPIRHKGAEIVELGRGKAYTWQVAPGRYVLENKTSGIEVTVEPGETRFVRCQIKSGFLSGRADLQIVDGTEYAELQAELEAPGS